MVKKVKKNVKNTRLPKIGLLIISLSFAFMGVYFLFKTQAADPVNTPGDVNSDNVVNIFDLSTLLTNWGRTNATWAQGDINADGNVTILDLSILLTNWGRSYGGTTSGSCFSGAVFCEDFEEGIASNRLRSGDLNSQKISFARFGGTPYDNLQSDTNWIRRADIPACRTGSVTNPFPPDDILICNPTSTINSHYGLVATTIQNYGDNWGRITQPFDIAGRTGKIGFDASMYVQNGLYGTPEIGFIDEPLPAPSMIDENGNGAPPRNGLFIHFNHLCNGQSQPSTMPKVRIYNNYTETRIFDMEGLDNFCEASRASLTQPGKLNRVEVRLSQSHIEVWISDYSNNGTSFGTLKKAFSANINLNFSRGWVLYGSHNHATFKYGSFASFNVLWDNIGFDGPVLSAGKTYQVPDNNKLSGIGMNTGYPVTNLNETLTPPLQISNVTTAGVTSAKISYNFFMETFFFPNLPNWRMNYRINGGVWHQHAMPTAMATSWEARTGRRFYFIIDVNPSELVNGTNTIQFAGQNFNNGYQTFVANIDLITN